MTVNRFWMPAVVIVILFATIGVGMSTGFWAVSGKELVGSGSLSSPEDIKGWMTIQQVSDGFQIPQAELYLLLEIPNEIPPETALKDLEALLPDFEVGGVRDKISEYLGGASPSGDDSSELVDPGLEVTATELVVVEQPAPEPTLPAAPAAIEQTPQLESSHVPQGAIQGSGEGSGPTPLPPGQILPGSEIKGRHTLNEIVEQCQVPLADLLVALGLPAEVDLNTAVKDLVGQGNISDVETVRTAVAELQNR